jgi:hypothetical protein
MGSGTNSQTSPAAKSQPFESSTVRNLGGRRGCDLVPGPIQRTRAPCRPGTPTSANNPNVPRGTSTPIPPERPPLPFHPTDQNLPLRIPIPHPEMHDDHPTRSNPMPRLLQPSLRLEHRPSTRDIRGLQRLPPKPNPLSLLEPTPNHSTIPSPDFPQRQLQEARPLRPWLDHRHLRIEASRHHQSRKAGSAADVQPMLDCLLEPRHQRDSLQTLQDMRI